MAFTIPEQHFTCPTCNYVAQVAGKRYFELGCNFHIETRKCESCLRLFDNVVTKTASPEDMEAQSKKFSKVNTNVLWKNVWDQINAHAEFLEQVKCKEKKKVSCRWCGSNKNEIWSIEKPTCPKCESNMNVSEVVYIEDCTNEFYSSFNELINSAPKIILCLVDVGCGICRHVRLMMDEIKLEYPGEFVFFEFNSNYADENDLAYKYKLKFLPTFLHFKNEHFVGKFSSVDSKPELLIKIRKRFDKKVNRQKPNTKQQSNKF